jgi:hypothetical protein
MLLERPPARHNMQKIHMDQSHVMAAKQVSFQMVITSIPRAQHIRCHHDLDPQRPLQAPPVIPMNQTNALLKVPWSRVSAHDHHLRLAKPK